MSMATGSFSFLGFALLVVLAYNVLPAVGWRKAILLVANIAFLTTYSHNVAAFIPLAVFLVGGYLCVQAMLRYRNRILYLVLVCGILVTYIWLKKYTFLPHASFLRSAYVTLGLSYIFFRVMHMVIDAHQEVLEEPVDFLSYLNYTLNFTTLVSGPIQDYSDFRRQHLAPVRPRLSIIDMGNGFERIVVGFFKVNVVALVLSLVQNNAIHALSAAQPLLPRALTGATIAATYPVYLYFNFSGYTDIVIGVARFLRIRLPENFDRPFSTANFLDFWNHWHMTLSGWLKKYVFNPLLLWLMRRFPGKAHELRNGAIAFFVTFFLIGIWHGRTSEFLFYGLLLGAGVSINKIYQVKMAQYLGKKRYKALAHDPVYRAFCRGLNFTFFAFYLLWFWSTWKDLGRMSSLLHGDAQLLGWLMIFLASTVILAMWEAVRGAALRVQWNGQPAIFSRYVRTVWDTGLVMVVLGVMELLNTPAPDIVYKAF